jgi:hypothetical protein
MSSSDIVIRVDRRGLILVGALVLVGAAARLLRSESLTITTSYPAPSGIYNQLVTTGNSGVVPADTTLNRNAGNTLLVPATNAGGQVGIGMAPASKLSVAGGVQMGNDNSPCTPAKAGTQRWNAGTFQVCNGVGWGAISGGLSTVVRQNTMNAWRWPNPIVSCQAGEQVLGGGGGCFGGGGWNFLYLSGPSGNGWQIACDTPEGHVTTGIVYALCGR